MNGNADKYLSICRISLTIIAWDSLIQGYINGFTDSATPCIIGMSSIRS